MCPDVERLTETLITPIADCTQYRVIRLSNRLEVLLASDINTNVGSASMCVGAGYFSENNRFGIAHAVEHVLYTGSKEFPGENELGLYVMSLGGAYNAYTDATRTTFFFECMELSQNDDFDHFENSQSSPRESTFQLALRRFAALFIDPLFKNDRIDQEVNMIEMEFQQTLQNDDRRILQLAKLFSNIRHPFHRFGTGNRSSLLDEHPTTELNLYQEIRQFFQRYYSANLMKLVVLSKESLDIMENTVVRLFSKISNCDAVADTWNSIQPLNVHHLGKQIFVRSIADMRIMIVTFPCSYVPGTEDTAKQYLNHLIGHEGPMSVLASSRRKGLATNLVCGHRTISLGQSFFEINVSLTKEGLLRYYDVLKMLFAYIGKIKRSSPVRWILDEVQVLSDLRFQSQRRTDASRFTSKLSQTMHSEPQLEHLLSSGVKVHDTDVNSVSSYLSNLRADNFRIMLLSNDPFVDLDQKEYWYGTEFCVKEIEKSTLSALHTLLLPEKHSDLYDDMALPQPNHFIPSRLTYLKDTSSTVRHGMELLRENAKIRLWWKKDNVYSRSQANVNILLRNAVSYVSPARYIMSTIFSILIEKTLEEFAYDARLAGLSYSIGAQALGLEIGVYGFCGKLHVLLERIIYTILHLDWRVSNFIAIKDELSENYRSWQRQNPCQVADDFLRSLVDEKRYVTPEYALELPHITLKDVKSHTMEMLSQTHAEVFIHGDLDQNETIRIAQVIELNLVKEVLTPSLWMHRRSVLPPFTSDFTFTYSPEQKRDESCVKYFLRIGTLENSELRSKAQLLSALIQEPLFAQLRTEEQLGYLVQSQVYFGTTSLGYSISIQGEKATEYVESRITNFLTEFSTSLDRIKPSAFEMSKQALMVALSARPQSLDTETSQIWGEIISETYNFDRMNLDYKEVKKATFQEIKEFYRLFFHPEGSMRRKLSVHVEPNGGSKDTTDIKRSSFLDKTELIYKIPLSSSRQITQWKQNCLLSKLDSSLDKIRAFETSRETSVEDSRVCRIEPFHIAS